ncbi:hypothetical protein [Salinilacihabitans rarus]|nr:hypothetical protein [Salinilacihabitans rarus]
MSDPRPEEPHAQSRTRFRMATIIAPSSVFLGVPGYLSAKTEGSLDGSR